MQALHDRMALHCTQSPRISSDGCSAHPKRLTLRGFILGLRNHFILVTLRVGDGSGGADITVKECTGKSYLRAMHPTHWRLFDAAPNEENTWCPMPMCPHQRTENNEHVFWDSRLQRKSGTGSAQPGCYPRRSTMKPAIDIFCLATGKGVGWEGTLTYKRSLVHKKVL